MISRGLLGRIEQGDPSCSVGIFFELAVIFGIELFDADLDSLSFEKKAFSEKLTLLPKRVRKADLGDDDF
jgi:hypothetical protein